MTVGSSIPGGGDSGSKSKAGGFLYRPIGIKLHASDFPIYLRAVAVSCNVQKQQQKSSGCLENFVGKILFRPQVSLVCLLQK